MLRPRFAPVRALALSLALACALAMTATACVGAGTSQSAQATTVSRTDAAGTVWLCRPGLVDDPCTGNLDATAVGANGTRTMQKATATGSPKFDCFYLYPTASNESTVNSDLAVQPAETQNAMAQAARFSQDCDVWAPMYRQLTVHGISAPGAAGVQGGKIAYASVVSAWKDFITHDDNGRPIVFIGHSQGSVMLIKLLSHYVDPVPALRKRTVVAIIAGGDVTVPDGKAVGVTFKHLPLCSSVSEIHCVIAYSSFPSEPPTDAMFGRPGQGIALNAGQTATEGVQIACVNPADIGGGTAPLSSYFPVDAPLPMSNMAPPGTPVSTQWVTYPGHYSAGCASAAGATWLQITDLLSPGSPLPNVGEPLGVTWGYHFEDINLSLGSLVRDVHREESAYSSKG